MMSSGSFHKAKFLNFKILTAAHQLLAMTCVYYISGSRDVYVQCKENMLFFFVVSASATAVSNSVVAREGQNVTLGCHGFGLPAPNISWFNETNVVMENGRIWSLYDINRNMAGQYTCTASNSCGNDSQKIDVVVQCELQCNIILFLII